VNTAKPQKQFVSEGVSIIGAGLMGSAYATRLSSLGVPVTISNRTRAKAEAVAKQLPNVNVAATLHDCVRATPNTLVACSPAPAAIGAICEQLAGVARDRHVMFIVDSGLPEARLMEELVFDKGGAASVTNVALFGAVMNVMQGAGALINASGKSVAAETIEERVLPLLGLFGAPTYHAGGTATAAAFAMGGHMAFMPTMYALMHYVAMMQKSGVDAKVATEYFQATNRTLIEGFVPMLAGAFGAHDYSLFLGSHQLFKDIHALVAETCKSLKIDDQLAQLMSRYHERAMKDAAVGTKSFHSVHEIIAKPAQ
jgi:3-hydroxyisobutyrate dehydrogenase-like beta-hydroxyacid dehydrogenase